MLANKEKKSLLKTLVAGSCGVILMAALTVNVHGGIASSEYSTLGTCLYSQQLASDPAMRAAYEAEIAIYRDSNVVTETDYDELYVTDINASSNLTRTPTTLDRLSINCLSCHDGVSATSFNVRIKNNPNGRVTSLQDIIGGHPVGMEFDKYISVKSGEYKREARFSQGMIYAEGKIGCLTCHNPLNLYRGHLVKANDSSALCFSCHNI